MMNIYATILLMTACIMTVFTLETIIVCYLIEHATSSDMFSFIEVISAVSMICGLIMGIAMTICIVQPVQSYQSPSNDHTIEV